MGLNVRPIFTFDFDGTVVEDKFPAVGKPREYALECLRHLREAGWILILCTCRHDEYLEAAKRLFEENDLPLDYYNENAKELIDYFGDCRKIFGNFYHDDKNVGFVEDWREVEKYLLKVYNKGKAV